MLKQETSPRPNSAHLGGVTLIGLGLLFLGALGGSAVGSISTEDQYLAENNELKLQIEHLKRKNPTALRNKYREGIINCAKQVNVPVYRKFAGYRVSKTGNGLRYELTCGEEE